MRSRLSGRPTSVYYLVDRAHLLLYVGIAVDVTRRLGQHRCESPWWLDVDYVRVETYATRREAAIAEAHAIAYFHPRANRMAYPALASLPVPSPITEPVLTRGRCA